jgi:hypothetical protein
MPVTAKWPTTVLAQADVGGEVVNFGTLQLSGAHTAASSTITVQTTIPATWPTTGFLTIDNEIIKYTSYAGAVFSGLTRGFESTTAAAHNTGANVGLRMTALRWNQIVAETIAVQNTLKGNTAADFTLAGDLWVKGPQPWVDVKAYGAVHDSVTLNAAAFMAAYNALPGNGGTIFVPNGGTADSYLIESKLAFAKQGVRLVGLGAPGTLLKAATGFSGTSLIEFSEPRVGVRAIGQAIQDIYIDMNNQSAHGIHMIQPYDLTYAANIYVYNVADAYNAWRIMPGPLGEVGQGTLFFNCQGIHKNTTATAPTWYIEKLQEAQLINCKGWGGPDITTVARPFQFVSCRGIQMRGGAAASSASEGILVTTDGSTAVANIFDGITFEALGKVLVATGDATYKVGLSLRDLRIETPVNGGIELSHVTGSDIESRSSTVSIDANCSQIHVVTFDAAQVTNNGVNTSIMEWHNAGAGTGARGVYFSPGVTSKRLEFDGSVAGVLAHGATTLANITSTVMEVALGKMTFPVGAVTTPSLPFTGDTTTGIYRPVANTVGIVGAGVDVMRFLGTAGNVNYWLTQGSAASFAVTLRSTGTDTNIAATYITKGTGTHSFWSGNGGTQQFQITAGSGARTQDGTVSLPGLGFINDTDNGVYRIGTDNWAHSVGGSKVIEMLRTGGADQLAFFGVTIAARPTAYTQTYSTADKTHAADGSSDLATTAATQTTPWGFATQAQADNIATQVNLLRATVTDLKQLVNSIIDDGQSLGLFQ